MGKPNSGHTLLLVFIRERTWGSETSQYPEEKKANVSLNKILRLRETPFTKVYWGL
jgi:hypothetical protein